MSNSAKVRCRRHPGRRGATLPSSSRLLKRATYLVTAELHHDVGGREQPRRRAAATTTPGERKCISAPPSRRTPTTKRRRATTNLTTSVSQSRSVRSCRCAAPACRNEVAIRLAAPPRRRRSRGARRRRRSAPRARGRSRDRRRSPGRRAGSSSSRGSSTSIPSNWCRSDSARSGRSQSGRRSDRSGARGNRRRPRRAHGAAAVGAATRASRRDRDPSAALARGVAAMRRIRYAAVRVPTVPGCRMTCSPLLTSAPTRLPPRTRQVHDRRDRGEHQFALLGQGRAEVDAG